MLRRPQAICIPFLKYIGLAVMKQRQDLTVRRSELRLGKVTHTTSALGASDVTVDICAYKQEGAGNSDGRLAHVAAQWRDDEGNTVPKTIFLDPCLTTARQLTF